MNNYPSNYPNEPRAEYPFEYQQGYQSQPYPQPSQQPVYPPGPYSPPSTPGYPQQPGPGLAYPQQQMMMPQQMAYPQPVNVVVNNSVGYAGPAARRHPPTIIRLIWFFCFGLYFGMCWLSLALFFCCTIVGIPLGIMMLKQVPTIMLL